MNKILGKTVSIILNILLAIAILILIIVAYNYYQTNIMKKDYTNFFGYSVFKVASGSMSNAINVGDIIIAEIRKNDEKLKKDDIIVFKQDNSIITHRIIDIDGENIITKGDANNTEDAPITKEAVIGKVIKIIPNVAIWKKVFTSPEVFISAITTIILFGIAFSYNGNKNDDKNKQQTLPEEKKEDKE